MRRTSLKAGLGVLVLVGAALAGCQSDDADEPSCQLATAPPSTAPQAGTAGVSVIEQGHTTVPPNFPRDNNTFPRVSIGAVLQNTGDQVAYRIRVAFDALRPSGTSVVSGPQVRYTVMEVPILQPGAKVSVGLTLVADERSTVAKVTVTPTVTAWLPPGDASNGLAPVSATVAPELSRRDADGSALVGFTSESPNCTDLLSRGITFAWRDTTGKIVGGNVDGQTKQSACQTGGTTRPTTAMSQAYTVPASADPARTEVSALCDIARKSAGTGPGQPIN